MIWHLFCGDLSQSEKLSEIKPPLLFLIFSMIWKTYIKFSSDILLFSNNKPVWPSTSKIVLIRQTTCQVKELKTNSQKPCQFPFIWKGVKNYGCTTVDGGGIAWCSTKVVPTTLEHDVTDEYYGDCDENEDACFNPEPTTATPTRTTPQPEPEPENIDYTDRVRPSFNYITWHITVFFSNAYPRTNTTILYLIQILRFLFFFPPSYVVTKLTYSLRSFMSKYS